MKSKLAIFAFLAAALAVAAQDTDKDAHTLSPLFPSPAYEQLKSLAGHWEGTYPGGQQSVKADFRVVSGGSVVVLTMGEGTSEEMITTFHPDGRDLLATHYCAARNQPRMRLKPSPEKNVLRFDFVDVTNLPGPSAGHMRRLAITILDADHHIQEWTWSQDGKEETGRFEMRRVKL